MSGSRSVMRSSCWRPSDFSPTPRGNFAGPFSAGAGKLAKATWPVLLTVIRALVYAAIGVQGMRLAIGLRGSPSGPEPLVRAALAWPFGEWLVVMAGLAIAYYGIIEIIDAIKGKLEPDLDAATLRRRAGEWALYVARGGIGARV